MKIPRKEIYQKIDQELISPNTIRHYAIMELFRNLYPKNGYTKTQAVEHLASRFNLTPRQVWNVIQKQGN